jgi:hypothetical protein
VDINWPAFAHAILTTREFIQKLKTDWKQDLRFLFIINFSIERKIASK